MSEVTAFGVPDVWNKAAYALLRPWRTWLESDGSLVIRVSDAPCCFIRVLPWSMRMRWGVRSEWTERGEGRRLGWAWRREEHQLNLLDYQWGHMRGLPVWQFVQGIPRQFRDAFGTYSYCQSILLQLLSTYPEARDLAIHNPNLLWLLAQASTTGQVPWYEICELLQKKQDHVLSRSVGRVRGKAIVKFLRKVVVTDGTKAFFIQLRAVVGQSDTVALFAHHWQRIPQPAVTLVTETKSPVLSLCLAKELRSSCSHYGPINYADCRSLWEDLQRLSRMINTAAAHSALDRVQSLDQMRRLHDRWTEKALEDEKKELLASDAALIPFPTSPLGGNDQVVPIDNFRELYLESAAMHHCAWQRADLAIEGKAYYYRVYYPERGTVEIQRKNNAWVVTEFKLPYNAEPSLKSRQYLRGWLETAVTKCSHKWSLPSIKRTAGMPPLRTFTLSISGGV